MPIKYAPVNLGQIEAVLNKIGGEEAIPRLLAGQLIVVEHGESSAPRPIFEHVGTFTVPPASEFIAAKKFVVDMSERARVRIASIGSNFEKFMLPKVERNLEGGERKLSGLIEPAYDLPQTPDKLGTIAGLGGMTKARTSLHDFYETLAHKQARGDCSWTVGYVDDINDVPWAVNAYWNDGWLVEAYSVDYPFVWYAGLEFVSR